MSPVFRVWSDSISNTWELAGNANSESYQRPTEKETGCGGPALSVLISLSGDSDASLRTDVKLW